MAIPEAVLELILELVFRIAGNVTGRLLIAGGTLGRATVLPPGVDGEHKSSDRWHGVARRADGRIVVKSESATVVGIAFWLAIAFVVLVVLAIRHR